MKQPKLEELKFWHYCCQTFRRIENRKKHNFLPKDQKRVQEIHKKFSLISRKLKDLHKSPRLKNLRHPFSEILFILLSLQTHEPNFTRSWKALRERYPKWSDLARDQTSSIASTIQVGGLGEWKAALIKRIAEKIILDFGSPDRLKQLAKKSDLSMESYLRSLPGIETKSARCIMMYSFDREVFPVDTNIFRIAKRLGVIPPRAKERPKWVHDFLQEITPKSERYHLHVNLIAHGRKVCRSSTPLCHQCGISAWCEYFQKR